MFKYNIAVAKLGIVTPVTVPTEEQHALHAAHGLKQRINDTLAGFKLAEDGSNLDEGLKAVAKVIAKIEAGVVGQRVAAPQKSLAEQLGALSDEEFDRLVADRQAKRAA